LFDLVENEVAPGTGIEPVEFWESFEELVLTYGARNRALLDERSQLQKKIDAWHRANPAPIDVAKYRKFLESIGYLVDEPEAFKVSTKNVDREVCSVAAPQLVVPIDNARYALNAANARWGSLFDALYGTDAIPFSERLEKSAQYNAKRGTAVFERVAEFLDEAVPLAGGSHSDVVAYRLTTDTPAALQATLKAGATVPLKNPEKLAGYNGQLESPSVILLKNNNLHIEICIDHENKIGKLHAAGVYDVILECAVSTIQDCEDSVAAVDADDKVRVYGNWTGIMKGTLSTQFEKGGKTVTRTLVDDRHYVDVDGKALTLPGRSVLLVRNVGIHMYTNAVQQTDNSDVPEGFLDLMVTALAAKHDLLAKDRPVNSRAGSVYIVKPKMHGPKEVAFTVELFEFVEKALKMESETLKIGIMDEERRTTVNLKRCIYEARNRVAFINTGFLDRTGDELHTSMIAGAMVRKADMKPLPWLINYEKWNVDIGLECGLKGIAQIGKGMWAQPAAMAEMLKTKVSHLKAGATCAWVPSPTAATLHAIHYHTVNVFDVQDELAKRERANLNDIITIPLLAKEVVIVDKDKDQEVENNAQGILGYVARWIQLGVGCSTVPNINDIGLMEDRATLRISSQHITNWLEHGIVDEKYVREKFEKMAAVVDRQNAKTHGYKAMSSNFKKSIAFQAALDLVLQGTSLPNGYTEPVLHPARVAFKNSTKK